MKKRRPSCWNALLLLFGIALITTGIAIFIYFEFLYDFILTMAMKFRPGTEPFRVWRINDPPLDMDIYLFNWTNPHQLTVKGVKPHFVEVGPFRFKEVKEKINITWHDNDNIVQYKHKKNYYFDSGYGPMNLSERITTINIVPLTIAYQARNFGYFKKRLVSVTLSSASSLFVTKTAGEILFDGYKEHILTALSIVPFTGIKDKFGLFYGKNGSMGDDGTYTMWTKVDENFGKILTWNGENHSNYYEGKCNALRGSAGEFYPFNQRRESVEFFSSELCKFATLEYEKDVIVKGVKGYKFTGKYIFDNGTLRPENKCFCNGDCHPSGVFNVSRCRQDSPTFLSMPHFYGADPWYVNAIDGMEPKDSHEFYISLEPKSGIVMDISANMQVNMYLQPIPGITMYENVPKLFLPIFYFNQSLPAKDDLAATLRLIQNLPEFSNIAVLISISLGIASLLWIALNMYCWSRRKYQTETKLTQNTITIEEIPLRIK